STLASQFILPFANEKEKLKEPPQLYNFIEKSQWDAFVASSLSQDFEAMHSEQSQRREKCEYNHRLTRKGMLVWRINWKKPCPVKKSIDLCYGRRQEDKQGNIPDPKVAEKAKLIDDLKKQVSEGTLTVSGSNDVLTLALGTPEHGGRVRGVGAGVSPTQFFNFPRQNKICYKLKESVMEAVTEETKKMEARAKRSVLEAIRAKREILLKQFSQLIPNFDPNLLDKTPTTPITPIPRIPQEQSPKNPMSDKVSCSNVLQLEEDNPTNDADADAAENRQDETDLSKLDMLAHLLTLCQYVETKLKPAKETITVHMPEEVFGIEHDIWLLCEDILQFASMVEIGSIMIALYMRYLFDYLKMANMVNLVGLVNLGQVSSQSGTLSHCSKYLSDRLKNAYGDQFYMVPYNPG
ncbi:PREDICTED: PRUPE_6G193600, partial [Prunus dulcis]